MRFLLLLSFTLLTGRYSTAQTYQLSVADVRQSASVRQGTIEEATFSVRPKGLYLECGLYLTFSARGVTFNTNGDSLETVLTFNLPENAIVHDSWLWVGENIVKARILDRWSASTIYEGVVKRRTDPSLLVKNSATQYQLRVFPMAKNSTRKVKITWLQPADFYSNRSELTLPFTILKSSKNTLAHFDVLVWSDDRFQGPALTSRPDLAFEAVTDSVGGSFSRISLSPDTYTDDVRLRFASPLQDGYYLGTYSEGGENFYQLAVLPSHFLPGAEHRKVALLCDYEASLAGPTSAQLLAAAKNTLLNNLSPSDSFNLFFSNLVIKRAANHWLPAHPDTIEQVFAALGNPLSSYSNLQPLLVSGIQWIHEQAAGGDILLVSNASQFANLSAANALLTDFLTILDPPVAINVVDFNEKTSVYFYTNGTYYYANSYFLNNLAALSSGTYVKTLQTQTLAKALDAGMANLGASIDAFELSPSVENGFCYGKFNVAAAGSNTTNLLRPVLQVGKYQGAAPFHFELNGLYHNQLWYSESTVNSSQILASDTLLREMWFGRFVQTLENGPQANSTISNIIYYSLAERVLSKYTAFLCLDDPAWICEECEDETQFTSTDEPGAQDSLLTAFPNPFAAQTTLVIRAGGSGKRLSLEIFNLQAQLVRQFDLGAASGETRLNWDGTDRNGQEVPAGIYLGLLKTGDQTRVLKLVKIRK